jgi:hypothetical protein
MNPGDKSQMLPYHRLRPGKPRRSNLRPTRREREAPKRKHRGMDCSLDRRRVSLVLASRVLRLFRMQLNLVFRRRRIELDLVGARGGGTGAIGMRQGRILRRLGSRHLSVILSSQTCNRIAHVRLVRNPKVFHFLRVICLNNIKCLRATFSW